MGRHDALNWRIMVLRDEIMEQKWRLVAIISIPEILKR